MSADTLAARIRERARKSYQEAFGYGAEQGRVEWATKFALSELSAAEQAAKWQPIETAPKDGREVLLRVKMRAGVPGKLVVGHWQPGGHCIEDHPPIERGWYFWNGCMFDTASEPIEWKPLE